MSNTSRFVSALCDGACTRGRRRSAICSSSAHSVERSVQGKNAGAVEPLYAKAVPVTEMSLGPEYPTEATMLNNQALILENKVRAAQPYLSLSLWACCIGAQTLPSYAEYSSRKRFDSQDATFFDNIFSPLPLSPTHILAPLLYPRHRPIWGLERTFADRKQLKKREFKGKRYIFNVFSPDRFTSVVYRVEPESRFVRQVLLCYLRERGGGGLS